MRVLASLLLCAGLSLALPPVLDAQEPPEPAPARAPVPVSEPTPEPAGDPGPRDRSAPPASGEEPSRPAATVADEIVVAERAPTAPAAATAAVTVLTRQDIARLPAATLAELLPFVPGLVMLGGEPWGMAAMPAARGFFGGGEAEYLQLRVDGVPLADGESGLADWERLDAGEIERIEVLRGPAAALYGDTALAGVVRVTTRAASGADGPGADGPGTDGTGQGDTGKVAPGEGRGFAHLAGGSFGTGEAGGGWRGPAGPVELGATARFRSTEGFRAHSAGQRASARLAVSGTLDAWRWRIAATGEDRDAEEPGPRSAAELSADRAGSAPLFRFDREETRRARLAATAQREAGPVPLAARLWAETRDSERLRTLLIAAGLGDRALRALDGETLGAAFDGSRVLPVPVGEAVLRAGGEGTREAVAGSYHGVGEGGAAGPPVVGPVVASFDGRRRRTALFLTGDWTVPLASHLHLRLVGGTRWDRIDDTFGTGAAPAEGDAGVRGGAKDGAVQEAWSPRLGANLLLDRPGRPPLAFWLRAGRAFKAPTLDQLFDPRPFPDFAGGTITLANPELSPQRATDLELGARGATAGGPLLWEVAAYRTTVDDEIDFDPATFRYANIGATLHEGFEAQARLGRGDRFTATTAWTWQRAVPREGADAGRQLANIPEHSARLTATAALPADLALTATLSWLGQRWLDDGHRFPLGEATVLDLRLAARRPWGELRLDLLNLGDERYPEMGVALPDFTGGTVPYYFPAPGRAARLELAWDF